MVSTERKFEVRVVEVENGYIISESGPSLGYQGRTWVAKSIADLGNLMEDLAGEAADAKNPEASE